MGNTTNSILGALGAGLVGAANTVQQQREFQLQQQRENRLQAMAEEQLRLQKADSERQGRAQDFDLLMKRALAAPAGVPLPAGFAREVQNQIPGLIEERPALPSKPVVSALAPAQGLTPPPTFLRRETPEESFTRQARETQQRGLEDDLERAKALRAEGERKARILADPLRNAYLQRGDVRRAVAREIQLGGTANPELVALLRDETLGRAVAAKQGEPIDVSTDLRTTYSGRQYIDLGDYQTPSERSRAKTAAQKAKVPVVSKEEGSSLKAADTARLNLTNMWRQIQKSLPRDAGGRILVGPQNQLAKVFRTSPQIAAFNSWRAGAIQAVQALVERGMGFRLNQAEINLIMQNDLPQLGDTIQTAKQRIDNVLRLLENKEAAILTKDRAKLQVPDLVEGEDYTVERLPGGGK